MGLKHFKHKIIVLEGQKRTMKIKVFPKNKKRVERLSSTSSNDGSQRALKTRSSAGVDVVSWGSSLARRPLNSIMFWSKRSRQRKNDIMGPLTSDILHHHRPTQTSHLPQLSLLSCSLREAKIRTNSHLAQVFWSRPVPA